MVREDAGAHSDRIQLDLMTSVAWDCDTVLLRPFNQIQTVYLNQNLRLTRLIYSVRDLSLIATLRNMGIRAWSASDKLDWTSVCLSVASPVLRRFRFCVLCNYQWITRRVLYLLPLISLVSKCHAIQATLGFSLILKHKGKSFLERFMDLTFSVNDFGFFHHCQLLYINIFNISLPLFFHQLYKK